MPRVELANLPAIDFELPDIDGQMHRLDDTAWRLIVFHRHLG